MSTAPPTLMRALVFTGPGQVEVQRVSPPVAGPDQVVVRVERAGICGTDFEMLTGHMVYMQEGAAWFPLRPGHEWAGRVIELGEGVDAAWLGAHVTGDTMIGCGKCERCASGRHHVCADRFEIGIRGGWHGALAEQLLVPEVSLRRLPDDLDSAAAALVEPAGNAWRSVAAAGISPGDRVCVWGAGTIGLLCVQLAIARGAVVDVIEPQESARAAAAAIGAAQTYAPADAPMGGYRAVIDASNHPSVPATAVAQVEPGGSVVLVGIAETPAMLDMRQAVLRDVKITGILAASAGLTPSIAAFADGSLRAEPVIDQVVSLERVAQFFMGDAAAGITLRAPKVQVDPTLIDPSPTA